MKTLLQTKEEFRAEIMEAVEKYGNMTKLSLALGKDASHVSTVLRSDTFSGLKKLRGKINEIYLRD